MEHTWFFPNEIMTRRFVVGHTRHDDGHVTISRPWALPRGSHPAGGMSANAADQLRWARFHLGDGTAPDGTRILSAELLDRMKEPTADMRGSALGDAVGISWLLHDVGGVRLVGHGGTTNGQYSAFMMVPAQDFAFISMTNCGPNGSQLNSLLEKWALERYLGIVEEEPEPLTLDAEAVAPYAGRYETIAAELELTPSDGGLLARVKMKPEMVAALREAGEEDPDQPPILLTFVSGEGDRYTILDGPAKGMKGYFRRADDGTVDAVHLGGRLATRVAG
jgi:CubicO group peptidase (beta-lactamase class C family)